MKCSGKDSHSWQDMRLPTAHVLIEYGDACEPGGGPTCSSIWRADTVYTYESSYSRPWKNLPSGESRQNNVARDNVTMSLQCNFRIARTCESMARQQVDNRAAVQKSTGMRNGGWFRRTP